MSKTALDALWAKADAFDGMKTPEWARWAEGYVASTLGGNPGVAPATYVVDQTSHAMTARLVHDLDFAETYYVTPEMNRLVTAAAEQWEEEEIVHPEDFPSPVGWMFIPGGLTRLDIRGRLVTTSALSWHVGGGKVLLTFWCDKRHDDPVQKASPGWEFMPRLTPWHTMYQPLHAPIMKALQMGTVLPPEISDQIFWQETPEGMAAWFPEGWSKDQMTPEARTDSIITWLVSALRIMQTPIADVRRQGLPTNVRKALLRRPHRFKSKAVTIIEFRRRKGDNVLSSEREFSHRFLRRGHWRKQWMGSETVGDRRQVRIWIHPTIVGPQDKPFLMRSHVNALIR